MSDRVVDRKITQTEFDSMTSPMELDLISYYKTLEELVMSETFDPNRPPEELINDILNLVAPIETTGSIQVQKEDRPVHHRFFQGMLIGVENPKGSMRSGTDPNGKSWKVKMYHDYGFIFNTSAIDGDSIDAYIGNYEDSNQVFVVKQVDPKTKEFDEMKVMLGFPTKSEAILAYRNQYDSPDFFGGIVEYDIQEFKDKIFGGLNAKSKAG